MKHDNVTLLFVCFMPSNLLGVSIDKVYKLASIWTNRLWGGVAGWGIAALDHPIDRMNNMHIYALLTLAVCGAALSNDEGGV